MTTIHFLSDALVLNMRASCSERASCQVVKKDQLRVLAVAQGVLATNEVSRSELVICARGTNSRGEAVAGLCHKTSEIPFDVALQALKRSLRERDVRNICTSVVGGNIDQEPGKITEQEQVKALRRRERIVSGDFSRINFADIVYVAFTGTRVALSRESVFGEQQTEDGPQALPRDILWESSPNLPALLAACVEVDEDEYKVSIDQGLYTKGLGVCLAICSSGTDHEGKAVLGLCHKSSIATFEEVMGVLKAQMLSIGCREETIQTKVIGGLPFLGEEAPGNFAEQDEIRALAERSEGKISTCFNLATNEKQSLIVVLKPDGSVVITQNFPDLGS